MRRRGRALAFLGGALLCAGLAAALAGSYERSVTDQLGALRPAVVASEHLRARRAITPRDAREALAVRRIPERFAPPGVLAVPTQAVGLVPATELAPGAYVLATQLSPPREKGSPERGVARGLTPVEIEVVGAGALGAALSRPGRGTLVDVIVTTEPGPGGRGRTYVAARAVQLLDLIDGGAGSLEDDGMGLGGGPGTQMATLALTRRDAITLIQADSFARQVRLIAHDLR